MRPTAEDGERDYTTAPGDAGTFPTLGSRKKQDAITQEEALRTLFCCCVGSCVFVAPASACRVPD